MLLNKIKFDSVLLVLILLNIVFGFLVFFSASLGVMARYEAKFYGILNNQFFYGICLGLISFILGIIIPYKLWQRLAYFIWPIALLLCVSVFIPQIGYAHGGAKRWIDVFGFNLQPSEILKYANIFLLGSIYSYYKDFFHSFKHRIVPVLMLFLASLVVLIEPDLGTTSVLIAGIGAIFLGTVAKWQDIVVVGVFLSICIISFFLIFPHARERLQTFNNPDKDVLGSDYQIRQNLISLGSGGWFGFGYGQGTQKYLHLPEPVGDSVFASLGEELGFFGSIIVLFFALFINLRILYISYFIKDFFAKSVLIGTSVTLLAQTFLNIGSVSGAIPLTGVPLPLISHGSTALIFTLGMLGICTQIVGRREVYKVEV